MELAHIFTNTLLYCVASGICKNMSKFHVVLKDIEKRS